MKLSKAIILSIIFLISSAIGSCNKESIKNSNDLPHWYINPKQNNSQFLYGIAQGYTFQEAKIAALAEASSRLSTKISATTSLIREENNYSSNEEIRQNIKQSNLEINFNNYKISNNKIVNNIYFAEVEINKNEFITFYQKEVNKLYEEIISIDKKSLSQNILSRYNSLQKISEIGSKIFFYNSVINGLGFNILSKDRLKVISDLQNEYSSINLKIEFYIDNSSDRELSVIIKNFINKQNIKIIKEKPTSYNNNQITLTINSLEEKQKVYQYFMNNVTILIEAKNNNKILYSNKINAKGSSLSDYASAKKSAIIQFEKHIAQQNIFKIIGINE